MRSRVRLSTLLLVILLPCLDACAYTPGALLRPHAIPSGTAATSGCFDVAVAWTHYDHDPVQSPVLTFTLGNRCDRATRVSLGSLHSVVGAFADGSTARMGAYDPNNELATYTFDANSLHTLSIMFGDIPVSRDEPPTVVCADVHGLDADSAATSHERWLCVRREQPFKRSIL